MFNAEKLLGRMVMGGVKRQVRGVGTAAIGMGLFGVALAAFDHYKSKDAKSQAPPPLPTPPALATPPPIPSPPSLPATPPPIPIGQAKALLLVRAMIAAAAADGVIDASERKTILAQLMTSDATDEERAFLEDELASPPDVHELLAAVEGPEMSEQFYAASLLAIDVDTQAERDYLAEVAQKLSLDTATVTRLHTELGIE